MSIFLSGVRDAALRRLSPDLAKHLGDYFERLGNDFTDSTLAFEAGASSSRGSDDGLTHHERRGGSALVGG